MFMVWTQLAIGVGFLLCFNVGRVRDIIMQKKVQKLEQEQFLLRGDVTGDYGRSTYVKTFEKMFWGCMKRSNVALEVGIIEKRETVAEKLKKTCANFKKKSYWKMKFAQLVEISRSEHTILGIIWPVDSELVYFTRAQRLVCYYCGAWVWREYDIYSLTKKTADRSIATFCISKNYFYLSLFVYYVHPEIQLALAIVALFFRTEQKAGGNGSIAVISTLLMLPVAVLIPWMFAVRAFGYSRCTRVRNGREYRLELIIVLRHQLFQLSAVRTNVRQHDGA